MNTFASLLQLVLYGVGESWYDSSNCILCLFDARIDLVPEEWSFLSGEKAV